VFKSKIPVFTSAKTTRGVWNAKPNISENFNAKDRNSDILISAFIFSDEKAFIRNFNEVGKTIKKQNDEPAMKSKEEIIIMNLAIFLSLGYKAGDIKSHICHISKGTLIIADM
jgi:hypothetical protein